jgi:hypothetical protein
MERRKIVIVFSIAFLVSGAASSMLMLSDVYKIRSQFLAIFFIPIGLLSFPWIYFATAISQELSTALGPVATAMLRAFIIALGFSVNATLVYIVFFVWRWKWQPDLKRRIKLTKILIWIVIGMKIMTGLFIGWIIPHLGGHGPLFSWLDLPFILIGGVLGAALGYLSFLAIKLFARNDSFAVFYVYTWCAVMILLGVAGLAFTTVSSGALPLLLVGAIGVVVLFTRRAQLAVQNVTV